MPSPVVSRHSPRGLRASVAEVLDFVVSAGFSTTFVTWMLTFQCQTCFGITQIGIKCVGVGPK